jgi:hypothetical protein
MSTPNFNYQSALKKTVDKQMYEEAQRQRAEREREERSRAALAATIKLNDMLVGEMIHFGDYAVTRVIGGWLFQARASFQVCFVPLPPDDVVCEAALSYGPGVGS